MKISAAKYFVIVMLASVGLSTLITTTVFLLGAYIPVWVNILIGAAAMAIVLWLSRNFCECKKSVDTP